MEEGLRRVLVVDSSKVFRSVLAKYLRDDFEVREEADGDSAWQTLVLDASVIAVVSSANLPRLSGLDLLAKIRISKLRRICDIPFLLLVSGNESDEDRRMAGELGVSDFVNREIPKDELLERIGRLVNWEFATNLTDSQIMPTALQHNQPLKREEQSTHWTPLTTVELRACIDAALVGIAMKEGELGVISFGLDDAASVSGLYGQRSLLTIAKRLGKILQAKVGSGDSVGCDEHGRCIIVTPGTSHASCLAFAQRVCRGLAQSHISIGGSPLNFKASAGVVSVPTDSVSDAAGLLSLANDRLQRAQEAGGNRVVATEKTEADFAFTPDYLFSLSRFCSTSPSNIAMGALGLQLMPLIRALDEALGFGLPLDDMEYRCATRAKDEKKD
ncbi:MAG: response regulator [Betaproteobacteria bacterium]|uniref:Response regulator n=1 Tax=Candidatus Proximibacter danicus TaxID=2954365 RepID=A0A9D7K1A7_9PROT|nr:response regulator [Candidatus Proximibacter danicus]